MDKKPVSQMIKKMIKEKPMNALLDAFNETYAALEALTIRYGFEYSTKITGRKKCKCLQFEDNGNCRHIEAMRVVKKYKP